MTNTWGRVVALAMAGMVLAVQPVAAGSAADVRRVESGGGGTAFVKQFGGAAQNMPVAIWQLPAGTYDGIGSWMIPGNVPVAGAGQLSPVYAAVHEFNFINNTDADALMMLAIVGDERVAQFLVFWPDGRESRVLMPFDWQANRWYFPFVYKASPGIWAAFVYDLTAAASTYVGSVVVPAEWGGIGGQSYLFVNWFGDEPADCAGYPHFDVYRLSPTGFIGQQAIQSTNPTSQFETGPCSGTLAGQPTPAWSHFVMG